MEQRDIEIFLTLSDELHFGRAAERLHVSTARVSQTIKKAERRIGALLFERTSRRVELTPIGRRLGDELRPAYQQIQNALDGARAAGRGARETLRVGFVGAGTAQVVLEVADAFRAEHPAHTIRLHEKQFGAGLGPLRGGEFDLVLATVPVFGAQERDLTGGSVLFEEDQLLAVSARHPFARRSSVSFADATRTTVLRTPPTVPDYWDEALVPQHTPDGMPVQRGPSFGTIQEMLALVGAGFGTYPVSSQATSYYARPDVTYVPIHDAPPYRWRFVWVSVAETAAIRAFDHAAATLARARRPCCGPADEFGPSARSIPQDVRGRKERFVPAGERMFMINGAASCVEVQGDADAPTVLLVGSSMLSWPDELCERLVSGGRRVIRYDVRDTGRSESYPPGEPGYSLKDLVDDAVGVLDATATERAHVAGMSTGGWIAQLLALGHPERVATLTLVASRPNTPGPVDDDLPEHDEALMKVIMNTPEPDWSDERAVVDHLVLQAKMFAGSGAFDEGSARAHAEAVVARTTDVRCATTNIAFADHGPRWRERLCEITAPTLVLHGEDDPFFPIGNGEALAAEIPDAHLVRLERVGHWLPAHAVPVVADEVLAHTAG